MRFKSVRTLAVTALLLIGPISIRICRAQGAAPVSAAHVMLKDVPIYASGIGTVAADQLVQVKARVDGAIDQIAFTEGAEVKRGEFLVEIDPRPYQAALDQVLAKKQSDEAALADAEKDLRRDVSLVKTKDIPVQTLDTQTATVAQDQASVAGDQAAIESAQINLGFTHVTAPIAGRLGIRQVDLGNLVQAVNGTTLVTIAAIHPISVFFTLPQDQMTAITSLLDGGKPAQVLALSADNQNLLATGKLVTADNQIDTTTGTIKLKATFDNADNHLWPGEFVNVKLLTATLPRVLTVPSAAVQRSPDGPFLYVIGANNKVAARTVTLGPDDGVTAVITQGVSAGESVVTNGTSRLSDGVTVQIRSYDPAS